MVHNVPFGRGGRIAYKPLLVMQEIRDVAYPFKDGRMFFRIGQELRKGDTTFVISHFKRITEPYATIMQIWIKPPNEKISALWKEIVNGMEVRSYNLDFLCKV